MTTDRGRRFESSRSRAVLALAGCALFAWALFRTAWMCDDAFITLRTIDNLVNGFGLRWNVAERVQTFTHPLWAMLLTPFYAATREPYFTTLAVQAALALAAIWLLLKKVALSAGQAGFGLAVLVSSKAFVDFSTSGLENPLTHLLLVAFFLLWRGGAWSRGRLGPLTALASGVVLCRPDLALLVTPVLASAALERRHPFRNLVLGVLPLAAWEIFSLVYYGSLVPNTALAKLSTGVPVWSLIVQGWRYWQATAAFDPVTVLAVVAGTLGLAAACGRAGRLMALGVALHALFLFRSGGDFMSGRFLTAPLCWIVLGLTGLPIPWRAQTGRAFAVAGGLILAGGRFACDAAPLISPATFGPDPSTGVVYRFGVDDERRVYYPELGLARRLDRILAAAPNVLEAAGDEARRADIRLRTPKVVGVFGYYAGPRIHIVDSEALCDPFLARLPAMPGWRIGHFERSIPEGYIESRREGTNALADPRLRQLYEDVREVTQGPIWRLHRFRAIGRLALGR